MARITRLTGDNLSCDFCDCKWARMFEMASTREHRNMVVVICQICIVEAFVESGAISAELMAGSSRDEQMK